MTALPGLAALSTPGMTARDPRVALLVVIGALCVYFVANGLAGLWALRRAHAASLPMRAPSVAEYATGFVTVFFDTLGIGSFATTTSIFRAWNLVPDELIPGTLNVGHALSSAASAFVFIGLVPVDPVTLLSMIVASGLGAWLGAGIVSHLPRHRIRLGMGAALLAAVGIMLLTQLGFIPGGADALGLEGGRLALAVGVNFVLGGLMTLGIGLYAPCMIVVSLLGMNARAAFPIMMGSCAFLLPISGVRFIRERRFHPPASLGLTIGGLPALLIAAYLVQSLPLTAVRWVVIGVVLYTAITLVRAGWREIAERRTRISDILMQPE